MSVMKGHTFVMKMPSVLMWLEDSTVLVKLDSLGMVPSVRVRMTALFVHFGKTDIYLFLTTDSTMIMHVNYTLTVHS